MFMSERQPSGPEPKGGTTRYRRNWDTASLELLWSRTSKTVSHEGADLELDPLMNRKPVK